MARQILVPLRRNDRMEEIIPYIEKIAQPGMKVIFLIRQPKESFNERLLTSWARIEGPTVEEMVARYSLDMRRRLAEQKLSYARKALSRLAMEIAVEVYVGSLRKVVRSYALSGDVHCVMMRAGIGLRIMKFLQGTMPIRGLFKRPSFSPVLLVHPGTLL